MAKTGKLTARAVAAAKPGRHGDGGNLYLLVAPSGSRRWVFRFVIDGKATEAGLGSADVVSLAEARLAAHEGRALLKSGQNPIEAKRRAKQASIAKSTFGQIADALFAAKQSGWRNPRHRMQWRVTLETYAAPLYTRPVDEIDTAAVLAVLTPIWLPKHETAKRVRGRIEAVLDAAKAQGHRSGENPAAWRGHLSHLLPKHQKIDRSHHAAAPYTEISAFVGKLRELNSVSALAIEFLTLTATRLGETLGAEWSEIDLASKLWTIPAARMKSGVTHRVPLPDRVLEIIERMETARTSELVFPGYRIGRPLAGSPLLNYARKRGGLTGTLHGTPKRFPRLGRKREQFSPRSVRAGLGARGRQ